MQTLDDVLLILGRLRGDTGETIDALAALRAQVEESSRRLESPQAALEFIDFFSGFFTEAVSALACVHDELPQGVQRAHLDALRQIASNAAVEQRRGLTFRDKTINRPLPYEDVRPLLNRISIAVRDRLASYRDLNALADELAAIGGIGTQPADEDGRTLDRRALFTKWFGR